MQQTHTWLLTCCTYEGNFGLCVDDSSARIRSVDKLWDDCTTTTLAGQIVRLQQLVVVTSLIPRPCSVPRCCRLQMLLYFAASRSPPPWRSALTSLCGRSLLLRRVASPDKYSGRHEGQYCETLSNQIRLEPNHLSFGVYPIRCQVLLSACPFVCLSLGPHVSRTARPSFTKVSVNVRCGRGSVILWRNCFCGWHRVIT